MRLVWAEPGVWQPYRGEPVDPFVLGVTKPGPSNTGLTGPTTSVQSSDVTFSTADQTITDTRFDGNVRVAANNITFQNCHFRGRASNTANNIVRANDAGVTGTRFERCLFDNRWFPSDVGTNGAHGAIQCHNTTLVRCELRGAVDGVGILAPGAVTVEGCYIHGHWFFSPDGNHADGSHADGIQGHGGTISNVLIEGCTIEGLLDGTLPNSQAGIPPTYDNGVLVAGHGWYTTYFSLWDGIYDWVPWATSAVLFGGSSIHNVQILNNWLDGGGYAAINLNNQINNSSSSDVVITGNRVGATVRDKSGGRSWLLICSSSLTTALTLSGNVNADDGTTNNSRRNG
jgi:hypothetical protein